MLRIYQKISWGKGNHYHNPLFLNQIFWRTFFLCYKIFIYPINVSHFERKKGIKGATQTRIDNLLLKGWSRILLHRELGECISRGLFTLKNDGLGGSTNDYTFQVLLSVRIFSSHPSFF